jgi:EAL domain-containing protein (putative c-di-GMP-specific phosphodiesterase class I)
VLAQAIEQSRRWANTDLADIVVSVNVAAAQFLNVRMRKQLEQARQEAGVDLTKILLEITESTLMVESQSMLNQLHHLRGLGVQFAIDDFGTGYSSLSYLKRLPINQLKIDRSFIKDSPEDEDDNAIIKAIISMAHSLKLEVVAEGVETDLQLNYLNQLQCDQLQGFYFAKPMPVPELEQFCREFHRAASAKADAQG